MGRYLRDDDDDANDNDSNNSRYVYDMVIKSS